MNKKLLIITMTILMGFGLIDKINASTLTSYGNYTGNTNTFNTCGNSGTYSYAKSSPSVQGAYYWERGNIGATISGKAYAMSFLFKSGLTAQKTYDVVITMNSNDFTNTLNTNMINLFNGSSCENMYNNDISLLSFTNSATSGTNTNKIKFRIYANSIISWWGFKLQGGNKNITSVNNFGVKSITITEVDTSGNNQVIENNNNNTQNIIDNDKQNTQNIIDNVNDQLGNKCENLVESFVDSNNTTQYTASLSVNTRLKTNTTYSIDFDVSPGFKLYFNENIFTTSPYVTVNSTGHIHMTLTTKSDVENTLSSNLITITKTLPGNTFVANYRNVQIVEGNKNISYCEYGTYSSKIDDLNNTINQHHTYNETPSETIDRTEMNQYQEAEDNLLNSIDLSGAEDIEVSINANASNFIWGIVNRIRGISGKIVLLFTSILSLGIIKMVMNR